MRLNPLRLIPVARHLAAHNLSTPAVGQLLNSLASITAAGDEPLQVVATGSPTLVVFDVEQFELANKVAKDAGAFMGASRPPTLVSTSLYARNIIAITLCP